MRGWGFVLAVCLLGAACSAGSATPHPSLARRPSPSPAPVAASSGLVSTVSPVPSVSPPAFLPAPDAPVPSDPEDLADALATDTQALRDSIDAWTSGGDPSTGSPPDAVVLEALYQQRLYRTLAGDATLRTKTLSALPGWLRSTAGATATAGSKVFSLVRPVAATMTFTTGPAEPAGLLLTWFQEAEKRFGVDWEVLAAVMFVESKFGRVRASSSAGAQGPMQFIAPTWASYGLGGDVHDPHDAILGAANYFRASGVLHDERSALHAYNHSWAYVDAVQTYADQMRADLRNYFAYYNWQVFVLTTAGVRRLTGPGL